MAIQKWCIWYTPLRDTPNGLKVTEIPLGNVIALTGNEQVVTTDSIEATWVEVKYKDYTGWVYNRYLENLVEKFPKFEVHIPNPTADPNDAAQYMLLDGKVKYNMCGELCVAFIGKDDIETFVEKWKEISPAYHKWALFGSHDKPTGLDALDSMLLVYGYPSPNLRFKEGLTDPLMGFKISPGRLKNMLEDNYLIAGVHIDGVSGKLRGQGVGHWIVLDKIIPSGINGGWVLIYNPFTNKKQEYSYDEFINSCGGPSWTGLWVKRRK
jgi:hypothetical protein